MTGMAKRKALIFGISGQDGTYLADYLLRGGYDVFGTTRCVSTAIIDKRVVVFELSLSDTERLSQILNNVRPDEIYNLAARASSSQLFDDPIKTTAVNGNFVVNLLENIRLNLPGCVLCQASSSEIFAGACETPQTEATAVRPVNAYGASKAFAGHMISAYIAHYGIKAKNLIFYNHESEIRNPEYVTRKVTQEAAKISLAKSKYLELRSLEAVRDWGYAPDYMEAMWLAAQSPHCGDFIISTGVTHSIRDLCEIAFSCVGLDYRDYVSLVAEEHCSSAVARTSLVGNNTKAKDLLGWTPKTSFDEMIIKMVKNDLNEIARGL